MRHFEFVEGSSKKFWEVWVEGSSVHTRYGKLGATGQQTVKDTSSPAAAQTLHDKLVREKTGKGYQETASAPPPKVEQKEVQKAGAPTVVATITDKTVWPGWSEGREALCRVVGARVVVVSNETLTSWSVSPAGLKREREVKLPISGFRLSCLQPVGDDRVFVGDAEGHALVELSTGKVLSHSSSDWGRNSALLRGELVLIDRYLRDAAGVKNKFADADAETKAFKALLDSQPADGLAVLPLSGKAKQLRHVSAVAGIASWEDFGELVVGCRAQGFEVLETSEDLSTITELKRVRTPGSLVRSARVGDLVLGWNGSMTSTDVNVQVLDVKKRSKPRLADGLWKKTGIAAVQVVGDRLFAAATREKDMFLLTANHHDGTLSEDQEIRVGPGQALAVAVVGDLAVVLGETGGGAVLRV